MSYRNIDFSRPLYVEIARKDKHELTPKEQEDATHIQCQCGGSELRLATQEEVKDARDYYNRHNKCKHHLVYDEAGLIYDSRYCGICGKFIGLI